MSSFFGYKKRNKTGKNNHYDICNVYLIFMKQQNLFADHYSILYNLFMVIFGNNVVYYHIIYLVICINLHFCDLLMRASIQLLVLKSLHQ